MDNIIQKIEQLKKEKNAVILAHYYCPGDVQALADHVGDSFYLAKVAKGTSADIIVFAGVKFMGESAKILNPDKKVLMPAADADCPMAHMATVEDVAKVRAQYPDAAVVCYINSTAELKCVSDVCVTSANAPKIAKALPNKRIMFIPDDNLGKHISKTRPDEYFGAHPAPLLTRLRPDFAKGHAEGQDVRSKCLELEKSLFPERASEQQVFDIPAFHG